MVPQNQGVHPLPWPLTLAATTPAGEELVLRTFRRRDEREYHRIRREHRDWLAPWDSTSPTGPIPRTFRDMVRQQRAEARA